MLKKFVDYLLLASVLLLSLGSVGRISFFTSEVGVYLYEIAMGCSILVLVLNYRLEPFKSINAHIKPLCLFVLYLILNYFILILNYTVSQNIVGFLYIVRLAVYVVFAVYVSHHFTFHKSSSHTILSGLSVFIVLTVAASFVQYYLYPDLRNLSYLGWDPHLNRMFGLFLDPFLSAAVSGMLLLLLFLKGPDLFKNKFTHIIVCFILLVMSFLTYSRGGYLALFITGIVYIIRQKKYVILGGFVLVFALGLSSLMIPTKTGEGMNLLRTSTIMTRIEDYKTAIDIWRRSPLIGSGYNRIRYEKIKLAKDGEVSIMKSHSGASFHSSFLIVLVSSGVLGLILFMYALVSLGRMNELVFYSTIFLSIFSLTDNVLLHPVVLFMLVMYVSLFTLSDTLP